MRNVLLTVLIAAAVAGIVSWGLQTPQYVAQHETAFARVLRTGTLRCGYVVSAPALYLDPQTGEKKGFMVAISNAVAARAGLKVDWVEEVGFGSMFAGLDAGRYDAICSGAWVSGTRARAGDFTRPFLYSYVPAVVRADDGRFDKDLSRANAANVKLAVIDGDITAEIANSDFPRAALVSTPQSGDCHQIFLDVMTGKADMTFDEGAKIQLFAQSNPGKLKIIHAENPLRVFPWALAVGKGQTELASLLDAGLGELMAAGMIEKAVKANQPAPHSYMFPRAPFEDKDP